jgi:hypothetical protein
MQLTPFVSRIPPCDTLCECGAWADLFGIHVSPSPTGFPNDFNIECGATLQHLQTGTSVSITTPMYYCTGDSACDAIITWSIPGASPSSGTGLPSFVLNNAGIYTLNIYASCGGSICDTCRITFIVDEDCACGHWEIFSANVTVNGQTTDGHLMECGLHSVLLKTGSAYTFTSGGFSCFGPATCSSQITWSIPGASPSSGTGLPSFTLNARELLHLPCMDTAAVICAIPVQ